MKRTLSTSQPYEASQDLVRRLLHEHAKQAIETPAIVPKKTFNGPYAVTKSPIVPPWGEAASR